MDWGAVRDRFPTLGRVTYLNSCSMGAPSRDSLAAAERFREQWLTMGASAWYEAWMGEIAAWRKNLARLVGAHPDEVAWTPSVSVALGSLAGALDRHNRDGKGRWAGRGEVVVADLEFPTATAAFGPRPHTTLRWARTPDGIHVSAAAYAAQLSPRTQAVVASRVFYSTGAVQDVAAVAADARKAGALCIVDDYQATGQLPLDVGALGLDAAVGGSLKWLCGGIACGWLYVRRALIKELEPTHAGWWANAGMFDFKVEEFRYWDDARRFEGGEQNMPSIATANAALRVFLELGPERIARRNADLTRDLAERLADAGLQPRLPAEGKRSAILMLPRRDAPADVARLGKQGIIVDHRNGCVRLSPHLYNNETDNEKAVAALAH